MATDMATEESSRIFVRGLPPTMNEEDFKKHFGKYSITDTRLFPQRRIGYVGYTTPEDAVKAVKYFNRTFIRMSKIAVELARPVGSIILPSASSLFSVLILFVQIGEAPTRQQYQTQAPSFTPIPRTPALASVKPATESTSALKRKRGSPEPVTQDPKLQEFLQAMQAPSKLRGHAGADPEVMKAAGQMEDMNVKVPVPEAESDSEYENVPKKARSAKTEKPSQEKSQSEAMDVDQLVAAGAQQAETVGEDKAEDDAAADGQTPAALTDDDWLRSRTSRLLGLAEDDDEDALSAPPPTTSATQHLPQKASDEDFEGFEDDDATNAKEVVQPEQAEEDPAENAAPVDEVEAKIRESRRLYLRNLSYNVTEEDLRGAFDSFGNLDEVSHILFPSIDPTRFHDEHLIGTSDAIASDVKRIEYFSRCFSSLKGTTF